MIKIYHNPRCKKSRAGLQYLETKKMEFELIEYLKNPIDEKELEDIMEEAAVMMTGLEIDRIHQGLAVLADQPRGAERRLRQVPDYSMPNVSEKVLRIIISYTDYVNRTVWHKH